MFSSNVEFILNLFNYLTEDEKECVRKHINDMYVSNKKDKTKEELDVKYIFELSWF